MSVSGIGSIGSQGSNFDPSKFLDAISKRFLSKTDANGDGKLSSSELSELSSDAFKALDTDGDGNLDQNEIESALKKQFDEVKQARQAGNTSGQPADLQSLQSTPEGQLAQLIHQSGGHHHHHGGQDPQQLINSLTQNFLSQNDTNGDGGLGSSELSGLSSDAFNALDTNGDGTVSADELKTALQTQLSQIQDQFKSGGPAGVQQFLKTNQDSPGLQLLQAVAPKLYSRLSSHPTQSLNVTA